MNKESISFLGAAKEVGRSCFLLDLPDKLLLDCGVKFGPDNEIVEPLPVKTNLNAVILSHAHLDHSGFLPKLFAQVPVLTYLTTPTLDLSNLLWEDSLKIAKFNHEHPGFEPNDLHLIKKFSFEVNNRRKLAISPHVQMEFFDAGHIVGSSMVKLSVDNKNVLYTGDFNPTDTRLHTGADLKVGPVDTVIIESTYGNRNHPPRKELEAVFAEEVQDVVDRKGWALIPAFAIGRGQEIIEILRSHGVNADIYYDGMGQKAAQIMLNYPKYLRDPKALKKALDSVVWVRSGKERKEALKKPCIIVASAGMLQGGPILFYIRKLRLEANSKLFFTGYQAERTAGRTLHETHKLEIDNEVLDVGFEIAKYEFSAHASRDDMLDALKKWSPERAFLVHGDPEVMNFYAERIKELGIKPIIPEMGKTYKLF